MPRKKAASTPSPKPGSKANGKRKAGRPPGDGFKPTAQQGTTDVKDIARRIAFTLVLTGRQVTTKPKTALD